MKICQLLTPIKNLGLMLLLKKKDLLIESRMLRVVNYNQNHNLVKTPFHLVFEKSHWAQSTIKSVYSLLKDFNNFNLSIHDIKISHIHIAIFIVFHPVTLPYILTFVPPYEFKIVIISCYKEKVG